MSAPELRPLRAPQVYEQIADRLIHDIVEGRLPPGRRLPAERELAQMLEVGRSSVREAIASLQLDGIVETRRGSGSYVAANSLATIRSRDAVTPHHDVGPFALLDAREAFEPHVAARAARVGASGERAEEIVARMDAITETTEPGQAHAWSEADRRFHRAIAEMTQNPVIELLADQLAQLMGQALWGRLRDDSVVDRTHLRVHAVEHRMIYEAVREGDPDAAERHARDHLRRVRRYMEEADASAGA